MGLECKPPSTKEEISALPRRLLGGNNDGSIESPPPALEVVCKDDQRRQRVSAGVERFWDEVQAAGDPDLLHDLLVLVFEHKKEGLEPEDVITVMEILLQGHPDLLVTLNTALPEGFQCTVPERIERTPEEPMPSSSRS